MKNRLNTEQLSEPEVTERIDLSRERKITAIVLFLVSLFTLGDLIEDRFDGAPWNHILGELAVVVLLTSLGGYLIRRARRDAIKRTNRLETELDRARDDVKRWHSETKQLRQGLSDAIGAQLSEWKLSDAEKEVALLLLKGLSHKEISEIRKTTENTVRQQATSLYQKSGLTGRAELSAFFLEDLLVIPSASPLTKR